MQISRRHLFKTSAAAGGAAAAGSFGLADAAVAGTGTPAGTTVTQTLVRQAAGPTGWRTVGARSGESHRLRMGLGVGARKKRAKTRRPLIAFAQISDVHIVDAQSPMRLDFYDRNGDPDSPAGNKSTYRSAWRPQETLGAHVANAMVRRINEIGVGPVLGKPLALTLQTGDNTDNNQLNELRWNIDVLDGAEVRVDSGDLEVFQGVQDDNDPDYYDTAYWHPDGTPEGKEDDQARTKYGFPTVPGLLDAARAPFQADGLASPWYTAIGNHDGMPQGSVARSTATQAQALSDEKTITTSPKKVRPVTADPERREITKKEWVEEHFTTVGLPVGHGFTEENRTKGTAYYTFDKGLVRFVVLDSVNPNGYESGSIGKAQFAWLKSVLAKSTKKLVVIASHHTSSTMTNILTGPVEVGPRVLGDQIVKLLLAHENVIAWVNGHTHRNQIWPHRRKNARGGFWEINTASHIDWPQQARLIEIADNKDGTISIFTTMIDHAGPAEFSGDLGDPVELAGLSRLLSANDWQEQDTDRRGERSARNTELIARAPKFLQPKK